MEVYISSIEAGENGLFGTMGFLHCRNHIALSKCVQYLAIADATLQVIDVNDLGILASLLLLPAANHSLVVLYCSILFHTILRCTHVLCGNCNDTKAFTCYTSL